MRPKKAAGACLAAVSAASLIADACLAAAQPAQGSAQSSQVAPPSGQYAPPPQGQQSVVATYDDRSQRADRDYADRFSRWAARYCVDQRNNNTAVGAIIGGVLGAALGAGAAGRGDEGAGAL
ncbi:MAG: hypothetical protein H0X27_10030, partial [Caulobacteraceae bacterium]|nr:hypothetical protein [Caulobacteraceae bacterium]